MRSMQFVVSQHTIICPSGAIKMQPTESGKFMHTVYKGNMHNIKRETESGSGSGFLLVSKGLCCIHELEL